ncbi:MAG TPA: hypothetical protein VLJ17_24480 [Xanthobacteraceae bacterium]|nr:hypothetical protein [Xanthobacteraceae bacterium]
MVDKKVEISEHEFLQNQQLRTTVAKLLSNPQAKLLVQKAQKVIDPNVATPELDAETAREQLLKPLHDQIAALKTDVEKEREDRANNAKLASVQAMQDAAWAALKKEKWTQAGIDGIKKVMEEKGILDPRDAAAVWLRDNPPAVPLNNSGSGAWNFMDLPAEGNEEDLKKLIDSKGENMPLVDKMVRDALMDVRGQRAA